MKAVIACKAANGRKVRIPDLNGASSAILPDQNRRMTATSPDSPMLRDERMVAFAYAR